MTKLETSDPETSQFLRENLSVNKTSIPFSAIGPDHAIEHENRAMKVQGLGGGGGGGQININIFLLCQK